VRVLIPKKAMDEVEKLSAAAGSDAHMEFAKDESLDAISPVTHRH